MSTSADPAEVFIFQRREDEVGELRLLCNEWQEAEGFCSFHKLMDWTESNHLVISYLRQAGNEDGASEAWQAAALCQLGGSQADLVYLYVRKEHRGKGLSRALLQGTISHLAQACSVDELFLEVRASQLWLQKFYESFGLKVVGQRKRYYQDGEDAVVYRGAIS